MLKTREPRHVTTALLKKLLTALLLTALLMTALPGAARAESGDLSFGQDGELKILLVADTQDVARPQKEMLDLLNASLDAAKPELVIFLGDMLHGNDIKSQKSAEKAIAAIIEPVSERGIPFAVVFGNHDDNGGVSKEEQLKIYQSFPGCLSVDDGELSGCGSYMLPVYGSDGELSIALWFFDSGTYDAQRENAYDYVKQDQIDWFLNESEALRAENGGEAVPSYVFQHIIVPEAFDMLSEVPEDTEGAVRGQGNRKDSYYVVNPEYIFDGSMGEAPCPPDYNSGEFDAWKQGGVVAAFFGHDHVNDFSGSYEGIDLVMTPGIGFYIYGNGDKHGTRTLTLKESDAESYDTQLLYYGELVGKAPGGISSSLGARYELPMVLAGCLLLAIIVAIVLLCRRHRRKKRENI